MIAAMRIDRSDIHPAPLTPALTVLSEALSRHAGRPWLPRAESLRRIEALARYGAWIQAALEALELDLPSWRLRRVAYDGGQWVCSLSQRPDLPIAFDDVAEAQHADLPQAILGAINEAHRLSGRGRERPSGVPPVGGASRALVDCDDFA
jgi:hypothetical protein